MAAQTCVKAQHATLSGTTADTVTMSGVGTSLMVTNRDSSVTLYCRMDGTTAVAAADDTYAVLPMQTKIFDVHGAPVVSVVGTSNAYSVELY